MSITRRSLVSSSAIAAASLAFPAMGSEATELPTSNADGMSSLGYVMRARVQTIKGFSDLIASGHFTPDQQTRCAEMIAHHGRALEAEMDRFLAAIT